MGYDIFKNHQVAREVFEEVDDTLNFKLSKLIFEGPEDELTFLTKNTQPSLMAVSLALVRVIEYETRKKFFNSLRQFSGIRLENILHFVV